MPFCFGNRKGSLKSGGGRNRPPSRAVHQKSLHAWLTNLPPPQIRGAVPQPDSCARSRGRLHELTPASQIQELANKLGLVKRMSLEKTKIYSFILRRSLFGTIRSAMQTDVEMTKSQEFEDQLVVLMTAYIDQVWKGLRPQRDLSSPKGEQSCPRPLPMPSPLASASRIHQRVQSACGTSADRSRGSRMRVLIQALFTYHPLSFRLIFAVYNYERNPTAC